MPEQRTIRIFISSPADVRPERLKAEQIVTRLGREFAYDFHIKVVLWERAPLIASHHFQDPENIPQPRGCDIVVVILWSRLGVTLPADRFRGAISGRAVTGTEWEFEDALAGARESGVPNLLFYRKTAKSLAELDDRAALEQRLDQFDQVKAFIDRWFHAKDGKGFIAASHSFATTDEFENQLYEHLHSLLERRLGVSAEGVVIRWHEAPYRGLLSFDYEHEPVFFGRARARNELRELLARQIERGTAFVLVFGASGSGKSSLVKAGLLPDLTLPGMIGRVGFVRRAVFRPSDANNDPVAALGAAILAPTALPELLGMQYSAEQLAGLLREAPGQAALPIRQGLAASSRTAGLTNIAEARLVVVVDQLEEVFTIVSPSDAVLTAFVVALDTLAKSGLVWVIATMRSDFFDRIETTPALAALSAGGRFLLLPPDEAEIGQIILQPAREAGLHFERYAETGITLDETIRQAVARDRGALPLLSFLLAQLWQRRNADGMLTFAPYQSLGGLEGAIGNRAEEVLSVQTKVVQREFVPLLRELVTIEGGKPISRTTPLSGLAEDSPRRTLADALRDPEARLLISDEGQLRLAHEALLTHWPRARDQIAADARDLELRARLEAEAQRWRNAGTRRQKRDQVITGLPLAQARWLMACWGTALPVEVRTFIAASWRAARWRRARLWGMVAAAPVAVGLLAIVVWVGFVWWGVRQVEAEWAVKREFVRVPTGCFQMGSPDSEPGRYAREGPVHRVCIKAFDLAKFEVTQGEWRRVMVGLAGFPNNPEPSSFKGDNQLPVEQVNWDEAQRFVWLISFFGHGQYRLPSESEYEFAARAGTTTSRYWNDNIDDGCIYENIADQSLKKAAPGIVPVFANCNDGYEETARVGSFKPNPWGLYDMLGNVAAWTEDCYVDTYHETPMDGNSNTSGPCTFRAVRGGSWYSTPPFVRAALRFYYAPGYRYYGLGFRLVRAIPP